MNEREVDLWLREHDQVRVTREVAADVRSFLVSEMERRREAAAHRHPFPGNQLRRVESFRGAKESYDASTGGPEVVASLNRANVVTSVWEASGGEGVHRLVLDIDHPVTVVPSSTPGHSHVYIDVPMSWDRAEQVLRALASAGIVEPGYASASMARGYTAVRLPWVSKEEVA